MMDIKERATKYAVGRVDEALTSAIAQAYTEGHKDGYHDREQEIPMDLRNSKTEYVDLGLPSGTLWATNYEKEDDRMIYLPHGKAQSYQLPTKEQWMELYSICKWQRGRVEKLKYIDYIGPNGNELRFYVTGYCKGEILLEPNDIFMWLKGDTETSEKDAVQMCGFPATLISKFSGFCLPIRLVR